MTSLQRPRSQRPRRPHSVDVDWNVLLEYNPPLGYTNARRYSLDEHALSQHQDGPGGNDTLDGNENKYPNEKVVVILQSILHNLEKDIENERRAFKEKRRRRREERRIRRENRRTANMSSASSVYAGGGSGARHVFAVAQSTPLGKPRHMFSTLTPKDGSTTDPRTPGQKYSRNVGNVGVRRHGSFNLADLPGDLHNDIKHGVKSDSDLPAPTHARSIQSRNAPRRTNSFTGSLRNADWSRHSRDAEETDDVESEMKSDSASISDTLESSDAEYSSSTFTPIVSKANSNQSLQSISQSKSCSESDNDTNSGIKGPKDPKFHEHIWSKGKLNKNLLIEDGYNSLPSKLTQRQGRSRDNTDTDESESSAVDTRKDAIRANRREHLKKRIKGLDILPTLRKSYIESPPQSSIDHSDDTLSDTSSIHGYDTDELSPRSLVEAPSSSVKKLSKFGDFGPPKRVTSPEDKKRTPSPNDNYRHLHLQPNNTSSTRSRYLHSHHPFIHSMSDDVEEVSTSFSCRTSTPIPSNDAKEKAQPQMTTSQSPLPIYKTLVPTGPPALAVGRSSLSVPIGNRVKRSVSDASGTKDSGRGLKLKPMTRGTNANLDPPKPGSSSNEQPSAMSKPELSGNEHSEAMTEAINNGDGNIGTCKNNDDRSETKNDNEQEQSLEAKASDAHELNANEVDTKDVDKVDDVDAKDSVDIDEIDEKEKIECSPSSSKPDVSGGKSTQLRRNSRVTEKRSRFGRKFSEPTLKVTAGDCLQDPLDMSVVSASVDECQLQGRQQFGARAKQYGNQYVYHYSRGRDAVQPEVGREPSDRPLSAGTSGYSTDECGFKTTDSDDDVTAARATSAEEHAQRRKLNKYFLVLKRRSSMALKADNPSVPNGLHVSESCPSFLQNVSMSDLAIPDHMGQLNDQSENKKIWGVVLDMLFCVFEDQMVETPRDVIILPGCNIRPLVYKSAINGVTSHSQTVSGISKFQFVIDDSSTSKKHVFGVDSQNDLDNWYKVLKKAAALDAEITNDISTSNGQGPMTLQPRRLSLDDGMMTMPKMGYVPSQHSPNRQQKMNGSRSVDNLDAGSSLDDGASTSYQPRVNGEHGNQPSPRGTPNLKRSESQRQSIQDFKKRLRREPLEPEISKHQPVKAMHFEPKPPPNHAQTQSSMTKTRKSFGSFENLLKFKRKKPSKSVSDESSVSNDTESVVSGSSTEHENHLTQSRDNGHVSQSVDISATESRLGKAKVKNMSRSLELRQSNGDANAGLVRRASDIKDRVFSRRSSAKQSVKLSDLHDPSIQGFLLYKHHLKWSKLWCVVCRGCFYGFKNADDGANVVALLANCAVVYVSDKDRSRKHMYIFKLTQERAKSIYLCNGDYNELMKWLTVLQMESNSVISNLDRIRRPSESENESVCSSHSSHSGSLMSGGSNGLAEAADNSRSRSKKKKKAPMKPPRHSSCPPPMSRDSGTSTGEETLTSGSLSSASADNNPVCGSTEDIPRYDKALTHVWQSDRGYLFNAIRSKLSAYRKRNQPETIYNKDLHTAGTDGLLVVQDDRKGREVRRSRSFNAQPITMATEVEQRGAQTPTESPTFSRKRHKPLVVKRISATDLEANQILAGYVERKCVSALWIRYWNVLHEGTLFCFLTSDDNVTVDALNLTGYTVTSLVDRFKGKRFVLELSHENFTSLYLSMESREEMSQWSECINQAINRPSTDSPDVAQGACADCQNNRINDNDVDAKRKMVKQKLLEEVLRQKHELERKQAQRQKKQQGRNGLDSPDRAAPPDFLCDEQRTSNVTHLRQRRMSTQLKVETIQKQIEKPGGNKRGIFGFGKTKKLDENKNVFLQDQLKELNEKLHKIDSDLIQVDKHSESFDVNQNRKSMVVGSVTSPVMTSDRGHESDDDTNNAKTIKSAVQKWTNKTFSKTSGKKKPPQNGKINGSLSVPDMLFKTNGHVDLNGSLENGYQIDSDENSNPDFLESSVTDLTRPLSDLKLELSLPLNANTQQNGHSGSASPSSARYNRSNSRSSTLSSLSSPRREIDPSVLAQIDAFEELTKQVLGARSKDVPAK